MSVTVLATGGTIASADGPDGRWVPSVDAGRLVAGIAELAGVSTLKTETIEQVSGWNMTPQRMAQVGLRCRELVENGAASGIVVTHGTDTIEETMYMCQLLAGSVTDRAPIIFACAMRAGTETSPDGPRNLLNAVRLASSVQARGRGVLLTVNDQIHHASWVTKLHTTHIDTFRSVQAGPVGHVERGRPGFVVDSPRSPAGDGIDDRVPLVKVYTGMSGDVLDWHVDRGARGLVIEGTGAGNVPGSIVPAIQRAIDSGVAVIGASRCPFGHPRSHYGGPGGGASLEDLGVLRAAHLNAPKARIAAMVGLDATTDSAGLRQWLRDVH